MSTKKAFERAWVAQFLSGADDKLPSLPSLSCWDSSGSLRSQAALRDELDSCRRRIADLRQSLHAEEFIESYIQRELDRHGGNRSGPAIAARSTSALDRTNHNAASEPAETSVEFERFYSEPLDSRISRSTHRISERSSIPDDLYSEPIDAKSLERIPSVPEPLYAMPVNAKPTPAVRRVPRRVYEEINDVQTQKVDDAGNNSSDDESVANLVAIRQSVSRLSQFCLDGDAARKKLEMQAKRLSMRFTNAIPSTGSMLSSNNLDSVPESLLSPAVTPSACRILFTKLYLLNLLALPVACLLEISLYNQIT